MKWITHKTLSTVFGHEPINNSQAEGRIPVQIGQYFGDVRMSTIKSLETRDNKFGFTFDTTLSGFHIIKVSVVTVGGLRLWMRQRDRETDNKVGTRSCIFKNPLR